MTAPDSLVALRGIADVDVYKAGGRAATMTRTADGTVFRYLPVGADAIGDVQVVPAGIEPTEVPPRIAIDDVADISFADLLVELGIHAQRTALPGVQDKTSAAMINLPVARAGERFVLKLNPPGEYPHVVENEDFFLSAARASGLSVPTHRLVADRDGALALLVQRFDRVTRNGALRMLAVEDGCQAANRPPADKYLLSSEETFAALAGACGAPVVAAGDLIRQLAFAYLTGNGDAHAKNFSVRQDETGEYRVSPVYDVPCTHVYGDTTMALSIAGRTGSEFRLEDFEALGANLRVPPRAVRRILTELAARTERWLPDLDRLPFARAKIAKLRRVITHRRTQLGA